MLITKMTEYYSEKALSPSSFWHSVNILITKPHVINKKVWGVKIWFRHNCVPVENMNWKYPETCERLKGTLNTENINPTQAQLFQKLQLDLAIGESGENGSFIEVILLELLPKGYCDGHAFQLVCLDKSSITATFYNITPEEIHQKMCPDFLYSFKLSNAGITLFACCDCNEKPYIWLKSTVLPQFIKWGEESASSMCKRNMCNVSLALVSQDKYYEKYYYLKLKYGTEMVKVWPECTDPSKFVYEDIAIATYLLLLWEEENNDKKQRFVDLGCGNGLLVYILTKEGHHGVGLDVRRRQIWDMYSDDVKLEAKTIIPSDLSLFPETDWIIGNHSDELTPWIPVIAAKSSYTCNFFLLPCCAYNFDGTKYQRNNSCKSQYQDYLEHIQELCMDCGFNVSMDRLKIPSTKRICLVSKGRTYPEDEFSHYCKKILDIIDKDRSVPQIIENDGAWVRDFKPRETVERVRNCTQIDKSIIKSIVIKITSYLLEGCSTNGMWSIGKTVAISELVQLIPQEQLNILKSECGGIKTLLKNNHHIFQVESGKVQLRYPKTIEEVSTKISLNNKKNSNIKIKTNPCWFYENHPLGCPLSNANCSYLHVENVCKIEHKQPL